MESCFSKAMEMAGILDRMGELCQRKAKTININEKDKRDEIKREKENELANKKLDAKLQKLDKQIEMLDLQYHEIKHKLMKIPYSTVK